MSHEPSDLTVLLDAEPAELNYEEARDGLAAIVTRLESGGAPLDESLALWEKGEALARRCNEYLDSAEQRLASATGVIESASATDSPAGDGPGIPF